MTDPARAPHILVVDDHREIRDAVTRYLEKNGMRASAAKDVPEMDAALRAGRFDLVVLDVMMPGEDGLSAARRLAAAGGPPVLMLSALGEDTDRIVGLEVGADDYLVKPFNPRELLARVKAILRRSDRPEPLAGALGGRKLTFAGWLLDTDTRALTHEDGRDVSLTTAEFKLLTAFLERPRFVLSRDQLLDITSGRTADEAARGRRSIGRLERKRHQRPRPLGSCHGVLLGLSGSGQLVGRGIVQHDRYDGGLHARRALDGQIDRPWGFRLDPVTEPAQRAVGGESRADAGGQHVEGSVTVGTLHDRLDLGTVLVVVTQWRQGHFGFAWLAVA